MSRPDPLDLWEQTSRDLRDLLHQLGDDDWGRPSGLPGWSVQDLLAHLAHLESEAAEMDQPEGGRVAVEARTNQPIPTSVTEAGVAARRGHSAATLLDELETACARRRELLADLDTSDLHALSPGLAGELGWDLATWLRNRPIDLWVHEQDIRVATDRPATTTGVGAAHVAGVMTAVFPTTLRRLPAGTSVVARITGPQGRVLAARVGEDGRAAPFDPAEGGDVTLEMDDITWLRLSAGRIDPDTAPVEVTGDAETARTILHRLGVTP